MMLFRLMFSAIFFHHARQRCRVDMRDMPYPATPFSSHDAIFIAAIPMLFAAVERHAVLPSSHCCHYLFRHAVAAAAAVPALSPFLLFSDAIISINAPHAHAQSAMIIDTIIFIARKDIFRRHVDEGDVKRGARADIFERGKSASQRTAAQAGRRGADICCCAHDVFHARARRALYALYAKDIFDARAPPAAGMKECAARRAKSAICAPADIFLRRRAAMRYDAQVFT